MLKRRFGMHTLNITQSRYAGMTHYWENAYDLAGEDNGIDRFIAPCDLEVIGVYPISTTGFGNTVHFYDSENDVTIAMTHENYIRDNQFVGNVVKQCDVCYYEGTAGYATGNHIHLEMCKGYYPSKLHYAEGWALPLTEQINIEDYFYIDKGYTEVRNDFGLSFEIRGGEAVKIENGSSDITINNHSYSLYRMHGDQKIGVIAAGLNKVKTLSDLDADVTVYAKIAGANYYQMKTDQEDAYGTTYGPISSTLSGVYQMFAQQNTTLYYDLVDGSYADCTDAWLPEDHDVFSPAIVYPAEGNFQYARMVGMGHVYIESMYTFLTRFTDGSYAVGITKANMTPKEIAEDFRTAEDFESIAFLDGGGSAQMKRGFDTIRDTGRPIPSVIAIYGDTTNTDSDVTSNSADGSADDTDSTGPGGTAYDRQLQELNEKYKEALTVIENLREENTIYRDKLSRIRGVINE